MVVARAFDHTDAERRAEGARELRELDTFVGVGHRSFDVHDVLGPDDEIDGLLHQRGRVDVALEHDAGIDVVGVRSLLPPPWTSARDVDRPRVCMASGSHCPRQRSRDCDQRGTDGQCLPRVPTPPGSITPIATTRITSSGEPPSRTTNAMGDAAWLIANGRERHAPARSQDQRMTSARAIDPGGRPQRPTAGGASARGTEVRGVEARTR